MIKARIPLLNDRHTHVSFYAALNSALDLSSCVTLAGALALLKTRIAPLVTARGWKDNLFDLSGGAADALGPVAVCNISLHSFYFNRPAREMLAEKYPEIISRIDDQEWVERHLNEVLGLFTAAAGAAEIDAYISHLASLGIWAAEDMMVCSDEAARFLARGYPGRVVLWAEPACFGSLGPEARSAVSGLKIFADGALGARSAALSAGYSDGGKGTLLHSDPELLTLVREAARLTGRLAMHAIGDAALEQVVRVLEGPSGPGKDLAVRIEHAQFITPGQARRAKKLGVALCMQPNFSADSADYADRISPDYAARNNPFRMLIDEAGFVPGKDLVFGSDGMPHGAKAALEAALFAPFAGQRLKLEEFTAGYCMPDLANGWIDATIDEAGREVGVDIVKTSNDGAPVS